MPVAFRSSSAGTASVGNITVTAPAGVADGDFLVAIAWSDDGLVQVTAPAGWAAAAPVQSVSGVGVGKVWTKTAASEPGSEVWTGGGNSTSIVFVMAFTGASGIDVGPTFANGTTASTTRTAPTISPIGADSILVVSFASLVNNAGADAYTTPTNMTERHDVGDAASPYYSAALDTQVLVAAGATGTRVSTATRSAKWQAVSLAVKSAPVSTSLAMPPQRRARPNYRR